MEPIRGKTEINDISYRYKMEKLNLQKERTKTLITNLPKIAIDLKIPSHYLIIVFLKKRLSIAITEKDGKIFITNDVEKQSIQNALYEFIEYFVLCQKCHFPELQYVLEKNKVKTLCSSCGHQSTIDNNQNTDKVIKLLEAKLIAQALTQENSCANSKINKNKNKKGGALEIKTNGLNQVNNNDKSGFEIQLSSKPINTIDIITKNHESSESFSSSSN